MSPLRPSAARSTVERVVTVEEFAQIELIQPNFLSFDIWDGFWALMLPRARGISLITEFTGIQANKQKFKFPFVLMMSSESQKWRNFLAVVEDATIGPCSAGLSPFSSITPWIVVQEISQRTLISRAPAPTRWGKKVLRKLFRNWTEDKGNC